MKKINRIYKIGSSLLLTVGLATTMSSCSDEFLEEKRPYGSFGPDLVYNDWTSVNLRLNFIYTANLPYGKNSDHNEFNKDPDRWSIGYNDLFTGNTEEYPGYGTYTKPDSEKTWDNTNITKFFYYGQNENPWKKIREINDLIYRVEESSTLNDEEKRLAIGQAKFFRATRYFRLWKRYGGVPIVTSIQSTLVADSLISRVPRQSTKAVFDFMMEDLNYVGENLPTRWESEATDFGRITAGTGYALAGVIANYYASPVFNRTNETERWQKAYDINKKALEVLDEGDYGLAYEGNPGVNASNWARIWDNSNVTGRDDKGLTESVYVVMRNTTSENDRDLYNQWEQSIRPSNALGGGGMEPSAEMVDDFPMADGKRPGQSNLYTYYPELFFLNRDPRFYRTFAFPGVEWKYDGTINADDADDYARRTPYMDGKKYELHSYAWYQTQGQVDEKAQKGRYADFLGNDSQSMYIRKRSQDYSINSNPLYEYDKDSKFNINGQPIIIMRYTEVLLNFAEAACGINKLDEAYKVLQRIRQRVGYTGDCGLDPAIKSDQAKMFEAILYERRIELAYEGKRFDDCHRWMLFDGGRGQETIHPSWALSGWSGNTCTYLGVTPLIERELHSLEMYFDQSVWARKKEDKFDPFNPTDQNILNNNQQLKKPKALTLKESIIATAIEDENGITFEYADANVQQLAEFYSKNLKRKNVQSMTVVDGVTGEVVIVWQPILYLMGLNEGDQENNPNVVQTMGWNSRYGGMGVFDPLSLNPNLGIDSEVVETPLTE